MEDGVELAGVLLKRSAEAGDASEGAGAANRSAPNRSLAVDYSQKIKQKYEVQLHHIGVPDVTLLVLFLEHQK